MTWLGLDIGGVNLKAADGRGWARSVPFQLANGPPALSDTVAELVASAADCQRVAVTMTGELCDCFRTKAEGVRHILDAVEYAARDRAINVYLVDGRLVSVAEAREVPHLAAASNWHALAQFACRFVENGFGLLVDIGSTTTDIIPLADGWPAARGRNDTERLAHGELVYSGVARTPVCGLVRRLPWRGQQIAVAADLFANTADAYVILGEIAEEPEAMWTPDGRPLTAQFARDRLARMICADSSTFSATDARLAAEYIADAQSQRLRGAIGTVLENLENRPNTVVVSGTGEFLATRVVKCTCPQCELISLSERIGRDASACAPAHALAVLAREQDP